MAYQSPVKSSEADLRTLSLTRVHPLEESLGRGAYGKVYTVKYHEVKCAAKEIHSILTQGLSPRGKRSLKNAFITECQRMKSLSHPNIVRFIGIIEHADDPGSIPVMVMELMDESLRHFVENRPADLSLNVKVSILTDVAQGLKFLHSKSIIHRDLTPNNILLKSKLEGVSWVAKISDFGTVMNTSVLRRMSMLPGTPDFMPPEAYAENPSYNASLDVFSYGGNILFIASCEWPTPILPVPRTKMEYSEVERRQTYIDGMSQDMEAFKPLVISCLSDDPAKRPAMVDVVKDIKLKVDNQAKHKAEKSDYFEIDLISPVNEEKKVPCGEQRNSAYFSVADSSWFVGPFSDKEAEGVLEDLDDGVFCIRKLYKQERVNEKYEICLRWKQQTQHIKIFLNQSSNRYYVSYAKEFVTINELVQYYQEHSLSCVLSDLDTTLQIPFWDQYGRCITSIQEGRSESERKYKLPRLIRKLTRKSTVTLSPKLPKKQSNAGENINRLSPIVTRRQHRSNTYFDAIEQDHFVIPVELELWYYDNIRRAEVAQILKSDGDCLVRFSENIQCYVLSAKWRGVCQHIPIQELKAEDGYKYGFEGPTFYSIGELLKYYVESRAPITGQSHFILKMPICKQAIFDDLKQHIISHDNVKLDKKPFSCGSFGDMHSAIMFKGSRTSEYVTIKKCSTNCSKQQFLHEAKILTLFHHPNLVKLLGVCLDKDPAYIVLEKIDGKNLASLLDEDGLKLSVYQLTKFSLNAAQGMEYLAASNCIHCDLAAKCCVVANVMGHEILKIADFSLCRMASEGLYIPRQLDTMPFERTAPEVLRLYQFSCASDVWSYGVLLLEIYGRGLVKPYMGADVEETYKLLKEGYRMKAPDGTPNEIYSEVMWKCWLPEVDQRPTFKEIIPVIKDFLYKAL